MAEVIEAAEAAEVEVEADPTVEVAHFQEVEAAAAAAVVVEEVVVRSKVVVEVHTKAVAVAAVPVPRASLYTRKCPYSL